MSPVIYMKFPHPKGNIPIRMRQRGQPGITIDTSTDTVSRACVTST